MQAIILYMSDSVDIINETEEVTANAQATDLQQLQQKLAACEDKCARLLAEQANNLRQQQKNTAETIKFANHKLLTKLLPILDGFHMALSYEPNNQGVLMLEKQFMSTLAEFGIQKINVKVGDEFDPNKHEALETQESNEWAPNQIIELKQPGFTLHDRVVKAAKVIIASKKDETQ